MLCKRIIAALDIKDSRVVKGIRFKDLKDVGDPVQSAIEYERQGIDEIVLLDISASHEKRGILKELVKTVAAGLSIPFTVGGGLSTLKDMSEVIKTGADKVFINSAALKHPELISQAAKLLGSANICVAVDAKRKADSWTVFINGGRIDTNKDALDWCCECERLGAGEILLTSMDTDGVREGFDIPLTAEVSNRLNIPVIASGGAGCAEDFCRLFTKTKASGALAASIFHYGTIKVSDLKDQLERAGINVRKN